MRAQATFVIPFYEDNQDLTGQLRAIQAQTVATETLIFDERPKQQPNPALQQTTGSHGVRVFSRAHRNRASLFNDGLQQAKSQSVCILPPDIYPEPAFAATVAEGLSDQKVAILYTDYYRDEPGRDPVVERLWPFHNNIDERFSLGFFRCYHKATVLNHGGFNEDLNYAEEYDLRLRLQTTHAVRHIDKPLYRSVVRKAEPVDPAFSKLHSPGAGSKGGFSYLFYTPEMEREIEIVFKDFLKRNGYFLTHPNRTVAYGDDDKFDVMVSIVIPILNRKRFIRHTVEIVLQGTFADFEILVVDNGSTDGTQDEVRAIKDKRVRLIQNNGTCIAEALNRGIREARGKYIAQLDSDDEYVPHTLETMVDYMESHPKCGLAISYYDLIDIDSKPIKELGIIKHLEFDRNNILRVDGGGALRFFHKKVLEEFGLYNVDDYGNFGEDYDMVLKIAEHYDVDRVHDVLYRYRRHEDNTDVQRPPAMKIYNKNNARQDALKRRHALNSNKKAL